MDVLIEEYHDLNAVDSWFTYEFDPYFAKNYNVLFGKAFTFFANSDLLTAINKHLAAMAAFKAYIATNPNQLKPNAYLTQVNKVNEAFKKVEDKFYSYLATLSYPIEKYTVQTSTADHNYDPIKMVAVAYAKVDNYRAAKSADNTPVVFPENTTVVTTPIVLPGDPSGAISYHNGSTTTTLVSQAPKPESSSGGGVLIVLGLAAAVLFFASKKKDQKDQK